MDSDLRVRSWKAYRQKAARLYREEGAWGVISRVVHRLASPVVRWGSVTFFARRLQMPGLPAIDASVDVRCREIAAAELEAMRDGIDPAQQFPDLAARFRRGDRAFAAIDAAGRAAHVRWMTASRAYIPEIDRDIVLEPDEAYIYNSYTRAGHRGRGIDGVVRLFTFGTLCAEGFAKVYSYARSDNPAGRRAAVRWQEPIGTVSYVQVGNLRPFLIGISRAGLPRLLNPQRLEPASKKGLPDEAHIVGGQGDSGADGLAGAIQSRHTEAGEFLIENKA